MKRYLGSMAMFGFGGLIVGGLLAMLAVVVSMVTHWRGTGPGVLIGLLFFAPGLAGMVYGLAYERPSARAERERPRTPWELREAERQRRWREEARAQRKARRENLGHELSIAGVVTLGVLAMVLFLAAGVGWIVLWIGYDSPGRIALSVLVSLVLVGPFVWLSVGILRGRGSSSGGGWSSGSGSSGDDFTDYF
jgi:hypothetical protein